MKIRHGFTIAALLFVVFALAVADRARAEPVEDVHSYCNGLAMVMYEAASARDRGVTYEEAMEIVRGEAPIYAQIVTVAFENPSDSPASLAAGLYEFCTSELEGR